jgi:hypothetical protein
MHPETGLPAQMPTAAFISKVYAGDMPHYPCLMLFCIFSPTVSQSVLSPT